MDIQIAGNFPKTWTGIKGVTDTQIYEKYQLTLTGTDPKNSQRKDDIRLF